MTDLIKYQNTDISAVSTADLKTELAKSLTVTADYLQYIAAIWQELETRGEDMTALRHGLFAYIPMIATRQLDARLVVSYAGQKTLLACLAKLPPSQQIKLAESGAVDVAALDDDNQQIVTTIPLADLTVTQVYQVFGDGAIAPPQQQYFALAARQKAKPPRPTKKSYRITSNIKHQTSNPTATF